MKNFWLMITVFLMLSGVVVAAEDSNPMHYKASQSCINLSGKASMTVDAFSGENEVMCVFAEGISCGQLQLTAGTCNVDMEDVNLRNTCKQLRGSLVLNGDKFESCKFAHGLQCEAAQMKAGSCDILKSKFSDVQGHQFFEAVRYVEKAKIVQGYDDKSYRPDSFINRAEFIKIAVEALYEPSDFDVFHLDKCFPDVKAGEWYTKYICFAKDKGVINGNADGTFKPSNMINYVEALKILTEAYEKDFSTVNAGDVWYDKYLNFAAKHNLTFAGTMSPSNPLTRGQMAAMIFWLDFL